MICEDLEERSSREAYSNSSTATLSRLLRSMSLWIVEPGNGSGRKLSGKNRATSLIALTKVGAAWSFLRKRECSVGSPYRDQKVENELLNPCTVAFKPSRFKNISIVDPASGKGRGPTRGVFLRTVTAASLSGTLKSPHSFRFMRATGIVHTRCTKMPPRRHWSQAPLQRCATLCRSPLPPRNRNTATVVILQGFCAAAPQHIRHSIRNGPR